MNKPSFSKYSTKGGTRITQAQQQIEMLMRNIQANPDSDSTSYQVRRSRNELHDLLNNKNIPRVETDQEITQLAHQVRSADDMQISELRDTYGHRIVNYFLDSENDAFLQQLETIA